MSKDLRCGRCAFRLTRNTCGCEKSPFYRKTVSPGHGSCGEFVASEAADYFGRALVERIEEPVSVAQQRAVAEDFEKAINLGLPEDVELRARWFCAGAYWSIVGMRKAESGIKVARAVPEFDKTLEHMEKALRIDRAGDYKYFLSRLNRARLQPFDAALLNRSAHIADSDGPDAAIEFPKARMALVDHLPSTPLIASALELANLYANARKDYAAALPLYRAIVAAEPVFWPEMDERLAALEAEARQMARDNIRIAEAHIHEADQPKGRAGCFIATAVYGSGSHPAVVRLRRLRDQRLVRSAFGRAFVTCYYELAPPLANILGRSPTLARLARSIILGPLHSFLGWLDKR